MFYIKEIKNALKTFLDMLYNFKRFYRKTELNIQRVNLNKLISKVLEELNSEIAQKNIEVKKQFDKDEIFLYADEQQLKEVFENILVNAIYHSPYNCKITITISTNDSEVIVRFKDEGMGIPGNMFEKIFEPFYTTNPKGSGLGLSLVKTIIEKHGADIRAYNSSSNGGAVFEIILPNILKEENKSGVLNENSTG
jgi:signal transduction histidine kinase